MKIAQLLIIEKNGKESMKVGTHLKCNVHPFVSDTFGFLFTNRPDYIVVTTGVDKSMQKNFIERVANVHRKNQTNATCVIIHLLMQAI